VSTKSTDMFQHILIIGGGPVGLFTAIVLAQDGFDVSVIEKNNWPVDKVCGEGIMPTGVKLLKDYGVLDLIPEEAKCKFHGIHYKNKNGQIVRGQFKSDYGLGIKRLDLSQGLYLKAKSFSNIRLYHDHELLALNQYDNQFAATVKVHGENDEVTLNGFDLLLGCDGLRSRVRSLLQLDSLPPFKLKRMGARIHVEIAPWNDMVEVWWSKSIEAYVTPTSKESVNILFSWDIKKISPQSKGPQLGLLQYFPELEEKIKGHKILDSIRSIGPLAVSSKTPDQNNVFLLGDARLFMDGITGEGLSIGFETAYLLRSVMAKYKGNDFSLNFHQLVQTKLDTYVRVTKFALFFSSHTILRAGVFWILTIFPTIFKFLIEFNMGRINIWGKETKEF